MAMVHVGVVVVGVSDRLVGVLVLVPLSRCNWFVMLMGMMLVVSVPMIVTL